MGDFLGNQPTNIGVSRIRTDNLERDNEEHGKSAEEQVIGCEEDAKKTHYEEEEDQEEEGVTPNFKIDYDNGDDDGLDSEYENNNEITVDEVTVQVANPKPDVVYTHETVTSPTPEPTPIPTVTAIALPNKVTMPEYPPVSDYQFNSPDQYKLPNQYPDQIPPPNQYPDQIPPPNQYPDQYPPPNPYPDQYPPPNQYPPMESNKGYNTHPCVKTSLVLLFLLAIGFAVIYALDKTGTIKF
ncbi:hypothetical protein LSH36_139g03021 [Paralvinella palmiformis]|uniref:Uncharacterized protein n=1 Tax=Paralvinella palmiformis TaxID=53620 RepID=A0AAD9JXT3_9ANNE|nr:hypothetical protein LSH36_139g03021 [Paralvinella palmiformis]